MNRAAKMLSVLQDGQPHSRHDIFQRVGFMLTNNAAAELRAQGHVVEHRVKSVHGDRIDIYQLGSALSGPEQATVNANTAPTHGPSTAQVRHGSGPLSFEQLDFGTAA